MVAAGVRQPRRIRREKVCIRCYKRGLSVAGALHTLICSGTLQSPRARGLINCGLKVRGDLAVGSQGILRGCLAHDIVRDVAVHGRL